jgi:hypothetical protein
MVLGGKTIHKIIKNRTLKIESKIYKKENKNKTND